MGELSAKGWVLKGLLCDGMPVSGRGRREPKGPIKQRQVRKFRHVGPKWT